mmetsp:Transcript_7320/g.16587  ORF Transcript_7320/g.16587 Transcript_7320/m.16587 type:complete len:412 (+) Transcript_7320:1-1236(+)
MAGCTPEMFRVVIAAVKAMLDPTFGLHGVHATTMGATPVVVVNGKGRQKSEVNYEIAPFGSGSRSSSIGRALKLLLQNVGRAKLGGTESTCMGTPMKWGVCFGENEEYAKQWEPMSTMVSDLAKGEDAVTVLAASSGPVQIVDFDATPPQLVDRLAQTMSTAYGPNFPLVNQILCVICPEHYDTLVKGGYNTKAKLRQALFEQMAHHMLPQAEGLITMLLKRQGKSYPSIVVKFLAMLLRIAAFFAKLLGREFTPLKKVNSPESLKIVVAGGYAGKFSSFMPGFGVGPPGTPAADMSTPVTKAIEPRPGSLDDPTPPSTEEGEVVVNPVPTECSQPTPVVKRSGKIVGPVALMDISKPRGSELLDVYEAKLKALGIETKRYKKPTFSRPAPKTLLEQMSRECRSAILGLAD